MQTVLITGGTGMVGQGLSNYLIDRGFAVIVLTRSEKKSTRLQLSFAKWDKNTIRCSYKSPKEKHYYQSQ